MKDTWGLDILHSKIYQIYQCPGRMSTVLVEKVAENAYAPGYRGMNHQRFSWRFSDIYVYIYYYTTTTTGLIIKK